jgi:hypothetical protein
MIVDRLNPELIHTMRTTHTNGRRTFTIIPWDYIRSTAPNGGFPDVRSDTAERHLAVYEHLGVRLKEWVKTTGRSTEPWEILNGTSSINNHEPDPIGCTNLHKNLIRRIAYFFNGLAAAWHYNRTWDSSQFAAFLGIQCPADLLKPLTIKARAPSALPVWISTLAGIRLKVSPNEYHPGALWTDEADLCVSVWKNRRPFWSLRIGYSYENDGSSWCIKTDQKPGESLEAMLARAWQDFHPRVDWPPGCEPGQYLWRLGCWHQRRVEYLRLHEALITLFVSEQTKGRKYLGDYDWMPALTTLCMQQGNSGIHARKMPVTRGRVATLRRWATQGLQMRPSNGY